MIQGKITEIFGSHTALQISSVRPERGGSDYYTCAWCIPVSCFFKSLLWSYRYCEKSKDLEMRKENYGTSGYNLLDQ